MNYYDIHTHRLLTDSDQANICQIYNISQQEINCKVTSFDNRIYYSCGLHPWYIDDFVVDISLQREFIKNNRVVAIGEVGLDKLIATPMNKQIEIFKSQIELAQEYDLPVIIHCVKAWDELISIRREYKVTKPWIIHGFRGNVKQAEQLLKLDFCFSFGLFFNIEVLNAIYPNLFFIESDETEESIESIYSKIATSLKVNSDTLIALIEQNVSRVFDLSCF